MRFPWLDREDIAPAKGNAPPRARRDAPQAEAICDGSDESDEAVDEVEEQRNVDEVDVETELAAVRIELAPEQTDEEEHYMFRILGGRWTQAHVGEAADAAMAMARGGIPTEWAKAHKFPRSRRFHFSKYGREGARMLALEVARRGNFFCGQYYNHDGDHMTFRHTVAGARAYVEQLEWLDWVCGLSNDDPCFAAALQVRALFPACRDGDLAQQEVGAE